MAFRKFFNSLEPLFNEGGKYEKLYPIFEMVETIFYTSNTITKAAPHARSFVDMKRIMTYVVIATTPCILWAFYNTGLQTNLALTNLNPIDLSGWRIGLLQFIGVPLNADSISANMMHGALYFLPIYMATLIAGGLWEVLFATTRGHEVNEGFLVS